MKLLIIISILSVAIIVPVYSQRDNSREEVRSRENKIVDTRIDNMGYWKQKAAEGLVPVAQPILIPPAKYTGSLIIAKSVKGGKEDSPDVPVTEQTDVSQSENSVFINPSDNEFVLNSNNSMSWNGSSVDGIYGANYFLSDDAGQTWGGSQYGAGVDNLGDPTTAINRDGSRMYVNYIASENAQAQGISYSTDGGDSWTANVVVLYPDAIADKNHMWIDNSLASPYEGNLYVAFTAFYGAQDGNVIMLSSSDEGITWSDPMNISSAINVLALNQGVNIQTGSGGEVYACWTIYDEWPGDENAIGFAKSTDGGSSFNPATRIIENIRGVRNSGVSKDMRVNSFPVMAVDISSGDYSGNIYLVWTNIGEPGKNEGSDVSVYMIRSEDEGVTWGPPVKINQDPFGEGKKHYLPWITCDPVTGMLSVIWYDDRNVGGAECETWCANSFDGGNTWEDFKVSDVSFTITPIPGLANDYMGDYLGITAYDGMVYPAWTDSRNNIFMTYTSPFQTNNLPKPTSLTYVLDEETGDIVLSWIFDGSKDFLYYNIYHDDELIGTTTDLSYPDVIEDYSISTYWVTATHDAGESVPSIITVQWGSAHIEVNPAEINVILPPDQTSLHTFEIENTGELNLEWNIHTEINSAKGSKAYCDAGGGGYEYISHVVFGDIDNTTDADGYTDYTNMSTIVVISQTYDIEVVNGAGYPEDDLAVWIDWNQDDDFEDDGENVVCLVNDEGSGIFPITIPNDALAGETRMRVRIKFNGSDCGDPCGTTDYGEVEDYTIVVGWLAVDLSMGNIDPGDTQTINVNFDAANLMEGSYTANLNISNNDPDNEMFTIPVTLLVSEDVLMVEPIASPTEICEGTSSQLTANVEGGSGSYTYSWTSSPVGFTSTEADPEVYPTETTIYMVEVTDGTGIGNGEVEVIVSSMPEMSTSPTGLEEMCQDSENSTYSTTGTPDALSYIWNIEPTEAGVITANEMEVEVDWDADYSGTAAVTVAGVNDCGEGNPSESLEITINEKPNVTLVAADSLCIYNEAIELNGGLPTGGIYSGNGVTENGSVYYFNPEGAGLGDHVITYFYEDDNGCENATDAVIFVGECLGVDESATTIGLEVFPNPNNGKFMVKLNIGAEQDITIRILNNIGNEVYREELGTFNNTQWKRELDLSGLAQGIYFINVFSGKTNILKKLILRK